MEIFHSVYQWKFIDNSTRAIYIYTFFFFVQYLTKMRERRRIFSIEPT